MWVPPETKDPILRHHPTRRSVGYFGAVRLRDGRFFSSRETGKFNAATYWEFLKQLRQLSRVPERRVVVIADNLQSRPLALPSPLPVHPCLADHRGKNPILRALLVEEVVAVDNGLRL